MSGTIIGRLSLFVKLFILEWRKLNNKQYSRISSISSLIVMHVMCKLAYLMVEGIVNTIVLFLYRYVAYLWFSVISFYETSHSSTYSSLIEDERSDTRKGFIPS